MTDHNRIKILINDYVNDALPDELDKEIEGHVDECDECKNFLDKVQELLNISSLITPEIIPPKEIWDAIVEDIKRTLPEEKETIATIEEEPVITEKSVDLVPDKQETQEELEDFLVKSNSPTKTKVRRRRLSPKLLLVTFSAIAIVAVFYFFLNTGKSGWKLQTIKGTVMIDKSDVSVGNILSDGEKLVTGPNGSAQVKVPNFGIISLTQNSVVSKTRKDGIQFVHGKIFVNKNADANSQFSINFLGASTKDLSSFESYNITNNLKTSSLSVDSGLVEIMGSRFSAYIPSGFTCDVSKKNGIGIPYSEHASPYMIQALRDYAFGGQQYAVARILSVAQESDAVSLWHLLTRAGSVYKGAIFNQLASYVSPPKGLTQNSSLNSNSTEMMDWFKKISSNH